MNDEQPSRGAIRAAQVITGRARNSTALFMTTQGAKSTKDIARIIDKETGAPGLLEACRKATTCNSINSDVMVLLREAIAKATRA
jgi:hypothetical protein